MGLDQYATARKGEPSKDEDGYTYCDVYDYLEDLIEDESLDYTVYDGDETYGVLDYQEIEDE
jgi:hypothetical protein